MDREILTRQIRDNLDVVGVIGRYLPLKRAGANFKGLCPFHQEKTPSFHVHPGRQTFKCFGCGAGGDIFKFIQLREKVDFLEARRMLADLAGISLEDEKRGGVRGPTKSDLVGVNDWAQQVFRRQFIGVAGADARNYVTQRGISAESVEQFGIGLALDRMDGLIEEARKARIDVAKLLAAGLVKQSERGGHYDTFRHRLMFPIPDINGRIIGFGGRTLGEDPAKYLNTPATTIFDKSSNLFGVDRAKHAAGKTGRTVVVEGYTDCIMAHQAGFTETVATLGTAMTDAHAALLRRYADRVILVFDSDEAGQRAAERAVSVTLSSGLDVWMARVPEGKDPCDYILAAGAEAFEAVLRAGVGALEFKWRQVAREYADSATSPARKRAVDAFLEQLTVWAGHGVIDPIQRGLLVNQLSKVLGLPAEDLHRQLDRLARRSTRSRLAASKPEAGPGDRSTSPRQVALQQVIEVLLNEPRQYPSVGTWFDPGEIRDSELAEVGRELKATLEGEREFRLDEFLGRFESEASGRLITDLQIRGERRGQYGEVIAAARECIEACNRLSESSALVDALRQPRDTQPSEEGKDGQSQEDGLLRALASSARQRHFSPARVRRRFIQET
ncbi:MAG TPA: DNA primase [Phycisphaerae bacterium]|nr:DNA primase [Phycisphaerae bacterium]